MKTLVLYTSRTGSTKQYAEDIAKRVAGEAMPLKGKWLRKAKEADVVVYGGYVQAGVIQGLNKFLSNYDDLEGKDIIIFSVGMAFPSKEGREDLINSNVLDLYHVRFYQVRGSFDINKLGAFSRMMMKRTLTALGSQEDASAGAKALAELANVPLIVYDTEKIDKIVSVINTLSLGAKS